ncbi:MAG: glycosyltransferase family 2 protein [Nocardioides sp.]
MTSSAGAGHPEPVPDRSQYRYSVVIPVYNSERIVGTTVDRVVETFTAAGLDHEVVLVNDGSTDRSWEVIAEKARTIPQVVALDLLKNYGQHHANLAGLRESTGDYVITMDDDLQNPPDQALLLIDAAMTGKDVVFGEFERKQAAGYRRLGSMMISAINRRVFHQPADLAVSNYRILRRDVVDRICASRTAHPYITGQALIYSRRPGNVTVRHEPRPVGKSGYNLVRILRLVLTILFSYSSFPLRFGALVGFGISALSFLLGAFYLVSGLVGHTHVQGWTTTVVLLSIFNGFTIALLSMLGEYVVRTLNAVSAQESYHVLTRVPE